MDGCIEIVRENRNLVQVGQTCRPLDMWTEVYFVLLTGSLCGVGSKSVRGLILVKLNILVVRV